MRTEREREMSLRRGRVPPPPPPPPSPLADRGRVERLLSFSRTELALAHFAALAVGVPPDEARAGDKRDRDEADGDHGDDDEEGSQTRLLAEAQAALRDAEASAEAVPTERLRALQAQIYAALERGLLRPELARALRSVAARLQTAELTRDASATQMDYDAEEEADDDEDGGPSDALASGVEEEEGSIEPVELELRIEPGDGPEVRLVKRVLQRRRRRHGEGHLGTFFFYCGNRRISSRGSRPYPKFSFLHVGTLFSVNCATRPRAPIPNQQVH